MAQFVGRRLIYAAVGAALLLAALFLLQIGPAPLHKPQPVAGHANLLRRRLQGQDDEIMQLRARQEANVVAAETRHIEKQLSGMLPGGRRAPPT